MIDYIRRYLADPETIIQINQPVIPAINIIPNSLIPYLRRYLADPE